MVVVVCCCVAAYSYECQPCQIIVVAACCCNLACCLFNRAVSAKHGKVALLLLMSLRAIFLNGYLTGFYLRAVSTN
jgi:hypothetical protein